MNKYRVDCRKLPQHAAPQLYTDRRRAEVDWLGACSHDDGRRVSRVEFYNVPQCRNVTRWAITEKGNLLCASKGKYITLDILEAA